MDPDMKLDSNMDHGHQSGCPQIAAQGIHINMVPCRSFCRTTDIHMNLDLQNGLRKWITDIKVTSRDSKEHRGLLDGSIYINTGFEKVLKSGFEKFSLVT